MVGTLQPEVAPSPGWQHIPWAPWRDFPDFPRFHTCPFLGIQCKKDRGAVCRRWDFLTYNAVIKHLCSLIGVVRGSEPFSTAGCPLRSQRPPAGWDAAAALQHSPMWKSRKPVPFLRVAECAEEKGGQAPRLGAELRREVFGAWCSPCSGSQPWGTASPGGHAALPLCSLYPDPAPQDRNMHLPGTFGVEVGMASGTPLASPTAGLISHCC